MTQVTANNIGEEKTDTPDFIEDLKNIQTAADSKSDIVKSETDEKLFVDERASWERIKESRFTIKYLIVVYISVMGIGIDSVIISFLLGLESFRKAFGYWDAESNGYVIKAHYQSAWTGGSMACQVAGAFFAGWWNDRFGRRESLVISCVITVVGTTIAMCAPIGHTNYLVAAKCVIGIGIGILVATCPVYAAELANPTLKGLAAIGVNFFICIGQFLGAIIYMACSEAYPDVDDTRSYKIALGCQYILVGLYVLIFWMIPESPVYLLGKGKIEKVKETLNKFYNGKGEETEASIRHFLVISREIEQEKAEHEGQRNVSYLELFRSKDAFRRLLLSIIVLTAQIWVGVNFTMSYVSYFFELAGLTSSSEKTVGFMTVSVAGNFLSYYLMTILKRRTQFVIGLAACSIINLITGCSAFVSGNTAGYIIVVFMFLWVVFYQGMVGTLSYALMAELPESRLRSKSIAATSNVNSLISFGIGYLIPELYNPDELNMGAKILLIWAVTGAITACVCFFFLPETKDMDSYQLDQLFKANISARNFGKAEFDEEGKLILQSVIQSSHA